MINFTYMVLNKIGFLKLDKKLKIRCDISVKFKFKEHSCCIVNYGKSDIRGIIKNYVDFSYNL